MRKKIYNVLNKLYGIIMTAAFFLGALPLIPFAAAFIIGGDTATAIMTFIGTYYYPYVIAAAALAIIIGWIAMYVGKKEGLSVKSFDKKYTK